MNKFSLQFFENLSNYDRQDSIQIGGGTPTLPHCTFQEDRHFEDCARSCSSMCSSMCSTASTVASAFSSIETSISFTTKASTLSFDLATSVARKLKERSNPNALDFQWPARSCHQSRSHPYEKSSQKLPDRKISDRLIDSKFEFERNNNDSEFEEFSLGPGDPWAIPE